MFGRVEDHFNVVRGAIADAGGELFATMGDGVAAAFTSAEAAVRAAVSAQQHMPAIGLSVRMGIHTGEVERIGDDFRGRTVNRASRIMAMGNGGQILLSDVSAALVRTGPNPCTLVDLGAHRLRDLSEPERLWQVTHPDLPARFPPLRGVDTCSNNLPVQRSWFVGRECDMRTVAGTLQQHRLVTLTGVGGVGKTRLAVHSAAEAASEFANVWFVELAGVRDVDDVADAIARAVGAAAVADPLAAATALLGCERTLLVVDNCEHVIDGAAAVIDSLTAACPVLSVLATSREALGLDGECVVPVRPLDPATSAADLFEQRAAAAGADLTSIDRSSVEQLCQRLDGIPLAIELAAARTVTLGLAAIVESLDDRLDLLNGGRRRAADRHATMRAAIDWSYQLLAPDEQRMLRWLAVFTGGFELDSARHVAASLGIDERLATEHLASLVDKSMLCSEPGPAGIRYRMLGTMRTFALEELDSRGERQSALLALAEWVTTITDLAFEDPCNAAVERNAIRLEREADNWRDAMVAALRFRSGALAARLCGPPVAFFLLGRHDLADVVRPLLALCDADLRHRRAVLCALIVSSSGGTDSAQLEAWADDMQSVDDALGPDGLGGLMRWLALAWRGDFVTSTKVCVAWAADDRIRQGTRDMFTGIAVLDHFSLTDASDDTYALIPRALEVADRSDVAIHRATCLLGAAWGLARTDPDRSLRLVRRALDDIPNVPALTRLTLPGSASRLLTQLDPGVAAHGLLEQLDAAPARRSFVDLIPLFYAAELLDGLGHGSVGAALARVTVSPVAPYLSMMDFVDLARRASSTSNPVPLGELEVAVRAALGDLAASRGPGRQP